MDSIGELWSKHDKAITAGLLVAAVLLTGFIASVLTTGSLGSMQSQAGNSYSGGNSDLSYDVARTESDGGTTTSTERKRIERIDMDFEVFNVDKAIDESKQLASDYGGYSESEDINRRYGDRGSVTVRVPKENVSGFLAELESKGDWKLDSKNRNIQDVTDRYEELELELRNKRQELQRLEELINQTDEVDSLISIQERMGELRTRIQYLENQLQDIDNQVDYTRIDLHFEEPEAFAAEFELREAISKGYKGIFQSLNFMIIGTGYLLPFGLLYLLYRQIKRFRKDESE